MLDSLLRQALPNDRLDGVRLSQAHVQLEVPVANGRMDVAVRAPGLHLVIENKVDALESEDQVRYYIDHLAVADARFILLSPDGRRAQNAPDCQPLTYSQIARLLDAALDASDNSNDSASGRAVAVEYLRTLRREF